jgi:MOB kinase activator 1
MEQPKTSPLDCDDDFVVIDVEDPHPALTLSVTPNHEIIGIDTTVSTTQICATIQANDLSDDDSKRAPIDIVVALDVSGSMHGDKLKMCKLTLELLLRQLLPQDRFGLVSFADDAIVEAPIQKLTDLNKSIALDKIKLLSTRGCTNISGGIGLAAKEMKAIETPNKVRSVFLLTDGHANCGVTDAAGIVNIAKGCLGNNVDATIHCFGYGTDHDETLLADVSEATPGGSYYFVENDWNIGTAFGDALGGVLSVVAQNVAVDICVPPSASDLGVEIVNVYHKRKLEKDDHTYTVNLGDMYAEESRDVLFEVKLATSSQETTLVPHASLCLSYMDTIKKELVTGDPITCSISRPLGTKVSEPNCHVAVQWLRVHTTQEMALADQLGQEGKLAAARAKIQACRDLIKSKERLQADSLVNQLVLDLDRVMGGLTSHQEYRSHGGKTFKGTIQAHATQRGTLTGGNTYRSSRKDTMTARFDVGRRHSPSSSAAATVAVQAIDFYNDVSVIWAVMATDPSLNSFDTGEGYPAGVEYRWSDGDPAESVSVPAPVYIDKALVWIGKQIKDERKFPSDEDEALKFQTADFAALCGQIYRRIFRVYAIIYSSFFQTLEALDMAPYLNTCFKHYMFFCLEFGLLPEREMEPLQVLVEPIRKQYETSKPAQTGEYH